MRYIIFYFILFTTLFFFSGNGSCAQVSRAEKNKIIQNVENLMISNGYSSKEIKQTINRISWNDVDNDLPESFYTAIKKQYWIKFTEGNYFGSYYDTAPCDEKQLLKINNFVDKLIVYKYSDEAIKSIVRDLRRADIREYSPSFHIALKKGYLHKYIYTNGSFSCNFIHEDRMSKIVDLVEFMIANKVSQSVIRYTVIGIKWGKVDNNLSKSFYTAIKMNYISKYIYTSRISTLNIVNETVMAEINKIIETMIKSGYSDKEIESTIDAIFKYEWEENLSKSFYTSIEKRYLIKYIDVDVNKYSIIKNSIIKSFFNEPKMSNINKTIELMIDSGYSQNDIRNTVGHIGVNLPESFYTSIEKHYLLKYIFFEDLYDGLFNSLYYESAMSKINNYIEFLNKKGVSDSTIKKLISSINWERGYHIDYVSLCRISTTILDAPQMKERKKEALLLDILSKPACQDVINNEELTEIEKYSELLSTYRSIKRIKRSETMADIQSDVQSAAEFLLKLMDIGLEGYEKYNKFQDMKNGNRYNILE